MVTVNNKKFDALKLKYVDAEFSVLSVPGRYKINDEIHYSKKVAKYDDFPESNRTSVVSSVNKIKRAFRITYEDIHHIDTTEFKGNVLVEFVVDTKGKVVRPNIVDTFNIKLNETIIDRVMAIKFNPALQNGKPVEVKYLLPIVFK